MAHPDKLKEDCIVEALCDIRFSEPNDLPEEVIIGRLIDRGPWKDWQLNRLPGHDIPAPIRKAEESLRFQPSIQLVDNSKSQLIKIGSNVISIHFVRQYPGWNQVKPQLHKAIDSLFSQFENLSVSRVGLRYINAFEGGRHHIASIYDLDVKVMIGGESINGPINLNFMQKPGSEHIVMSRISSLEFVKGKTPGDTNSIADIDVFTEQNITMDNAASVKSWIEEAHNYEKKAFFDLIPTPVIKKLQETE